MYFTYTDSNSVNLEIPVKSFRAAIAWVASPYRVRIINHYSDSYVEKKSYRADKTGFEFTITKIQK